MNFFLLWSLESQMPISIIYMKKDGTISKRTIIVRQKSKTQIKAFCFSKQQIRTFLLDSILSCDFVRTNKQNFHFSGR
ncbi:WYL domain-containing protein [Bacillus subtilis]|nr:WYL domain-containing protein [Bacillus subtilis]TYS11977.1 WYL domain-containing protein [Bacillus subtilis]